MPKQYSIAEARNHLAEVVHEVERCGAVELTRRGKPVAVILSAEAYAQLEPRRRDFAAALAEFRSSHDLDELWADGDPFADVRDRSPGREPPW